jgi:hypothetical protein
LGGRFLITEPVILPRADRTTPRGYDFAPDREPNLVERIFNNLKHYHTIATRYE